MNPVTSPYLFKIQGQELSEILEQKIDKEETASGGLIWNRLFGKGNPYDAITWEDRTAKITKGDGTVVFEQKDVEVPDFWSQTATDIVASKYFRGQLGAPEREYSARQMVDRVATTIAGWGWKNDYFKTEGDYLNFEQDLRFLLINQWAAFNSPVWFNVGVYERPQCSACFILSVEDNMQSILEWYRDEGWIFKFGSGAGINLSKLRSSREPLSRGGRSSGPVSFMKGADGVANSIRSGGTTRRAAKMVILNADHPDIKEFIYSKKIIEEMTRILEASGIKASIEGDLFNPYTLLPYQNANNSVRVTDEFMRKVEDGGDWELKAITTGETMEKVKARQVMDWIVDAAWHSADPGLQFDTMINDWHTCPASGRINASNPCFTGDTLVYTDRGLIKFEELHKRFNAGEKIKVYSCDITSKSRPSDTLSLTLPVKIMTTGANQVFKLAFSNGVEIKATENHRFWTKNRGWVKVKDLREEDIVSLLDREIAFDQSSLAIKADFQKIYESGWGGRKTKEFRKIDLPSVWTSPFAEYVGYMTGDGSLIEAKDAKHRLSRAAAVLGSEEDADELLPCFEATLNNFGLQAQTVNMPNGTVQLWVNRTPFVRFLKELGMSDKRAHLKNVPHTIFQTSKHIVAAFLRGLFSADGCVYNGEKSRYIGLGSASKNLLTEVQQLLLSFGIFSRIYSINRNPEYKFSYIKKNGETVWYESRPIFDLRIAGFSIVNFREKIGFLLTSKQEKLNKLVSDHGFYQGDRGIHLIEKKRLGRELTYNLTEPRNHSYIANGIIVANCSEYMHLDNSACNLASLNLNKFLRTDGFFDIENFKKAVDTMITAQEITVSNSSYPTERITKNAMDFRELGLGYANLGSLLMNMGLAYDSDDGRAIAAMVTSIMCGEAYTMSAKISGILGPFAGYTQNREPMLGIIKKHLAAAEDLVNGFTPASDSQTNRREKMIEETMGVWQRALVLGEKHGFRNSQVTVLAPTGTIAFLMDCDTTGVEPELALIKYKKLVGGGMLKLINSQIPTALKRLDYDDQQIADVSSYLLEKETIEGAPHLNSDHLPIFDCSFRAQNGTRSISYMGHIKMMGAVQPFISGAISKTVNLPNDATPDDIRNAFVQSWKLGLKSVAVYRDGCKSVQPLNTSETDKEELKKKEEQGLVEKINGYTRVKLPNERPSITHKFSLANHEGYLTIGLYPDTMKPGETFITIAKEGSTISGLFDVIATLTSMCLQSGIPLKTLVRKFKDLRFEPAGFTSNSEIPFAKSFIDYIFKYLGHKFLSDKDKEEIFGSEHAQLKLTFGQEDKKEQKLELPVTPATAVSAAAIWEEDQNESHTDAPLCADCGTIMFKTGSCHSCPNCFATTGVCN